MRGKIRVSERERERKHDREPKRGREHEKERARERKDMGRGTERELILIASYAIFELVSRGLTPGVVPRPGKPPGAPAPRTSTTNRQSSRI